MSRRLFLTHRSPFARKVSIVLLEKGLPAESVVVDLAARSPEFVAVSPIGKVPVLVDDDGTVVMDSTVICEYVEDRYPQPALGGSTWQQRLAVRQYDEFGDSLAEHAISAFMARQRGDSAAAERAESVMNRILAVLDAQLSRDGAPITGSFSWADAAVIAALGYVTFRLGEAWRTGHPRLAGWYDVIDQRRSAASTRPRL